MEQTPIERLRESREGLSRGDDGASGRSAAEELSREAEGVVAGLWERLGPRNGCVAATGDLGRGELAPGSDLELLVLHPESLEAAREVGQAVKALTFELWSAGVGVAADVHPVGNLDELVQIAAHRFDLETAFLDGRQIAGDEDLWLAARDAVVAQAQADPGAFLARARRATASRRIEGEDATAALEPNLRNGRGGLVDLATIGWVERVCGSGAPDALRPQLDSAGDLLHRARAALHRYAGKGSDVLMLTHRQGVAEALFGSDAGPSSEVALMRLVYEQCRVVGGVVDALLEPSGAGEPPVERMSAAFVEALPPDPSAEWPDEATQAFLRILAAGGAGMAALSALDADGTLLRALPEWASIRCLPERRNYHRWAVDEHSFRAATSLAGVAEDPDEGVRAAAAAAAPDWENLLLAALLHDVGKGGAHDHSERGAELARTIVRRMGLGEAAAGEVAWLVRNHLLLSHMATRRDIADELLMLEVADRVGTEQRLHLLYLLTVTDGRATSPAAWTLWKATLTGRLYERVLQVLQRGDRLDSITEREAARLDEIRGALADLPRGPVEAHLEAMPKAWLLSQSAAVLTEQSRMMIDFHRAEDVRVHAVAQPDPGHWELTVVARDRPGLFSRISGALALHDLNVLGAEIYTRIDGVALEVFRVEALSDESRRLERVAEDARKAMRGRISLGLRLAEKRNDLVTGRATGAPPRVVVDNEASDRFSVVEVYATDRIGLLYMITHALAELQIDIQLAKVSTYGEEVVDVFYVADLDGQKLTDPGYISEVQALIEWSVAGPR